MSWQPRHTRLVIILTVLLCAGAAAALTLAGLSQKVTYYYSPSDIKAKAMGLLVEKKNIRLGGLVEEGSIKREGEKGLDLTFTVTDLKETMRVVYHGIPPDLFRDRQGVVAEGYIQDADTFIAHTLLAKHDENYMPPEVAKSLKKNGAGEEK
jgi:cytochrome c-type biogenesis protein CcmE